MKSEPSSTWSPPWQEELSLFGCDETSDGIRVWLLDDVEPLRGACWTLDTSESPSGDDAYSRVLLSEMLLQIERDEHYSLSPKACAGILRRAKKNNVRLPLALYEEMKRRAGETDL